MRVALIKDGIVANIVECEPSHYYLYVNDYDIIEAGVEFVDIGDQVIVSEGKIDLSRINNGLLRVNSLPPETLVDKENVELPEERPDVQPAEIQRELQPQMMMAQESPTEKLSLFKRIRNLFKRS